jgi:hypothetical protein
MSGYPGFVAVIVNRPFGRRKREPHHRRDGGSRQAHVSMIVTVARETMVLAVRRRLPEPVGTTMRRRHRALASAHGWRWRRGQQPGNRAFHRIHASRATRASSMVRPAPESLCHTGKFFEHGFCQLADSSSGIATRKYSPAGGALSVNDPAADADVPRTRQLLRRIPSNWPDPRETAARDTAAHRRRLDRHQSFRDDP